MNNKFSSNFNLSSNISVGSNNSDFDLKFNKKAKDILKQDNKSKLKKKKVNSIHLKQENAFKTKNKNKGIIRSEIDTNSILEKSFKSNKLRKKGKIKQKLSNSINNIKIQSGDLLKDNINNTYKSIIINSSLTIDQLALKLKLPPAEIITNLFLQGISVTVNQLVDKAVATQVAQNYGFKVVLKDDTKKLESINVNKLQVVNQSTSVDRAPIVTVLGHVDHGKTTLLDAIRNSNIVTKEIGGITQSITAYEVDWLYHEKYKKIIFIDTPGHKAFSSMRLRCSQITDIVILIVAADDGLQPQTIEVIDYIKLNQLPCIVAINKIDKIDIKIDRIKEQLASNDILTTDWGGYTQFIKVSALKKINIDKLLTAICDLLPSLKLKADPSKPAEGVILEAYLDKKKGIVVNLVILNGHLNVGDIVVSGNAYGRVKRLVNSLGYQVIKADISSIIEILGFYSIPQTGRYFHVVQTEKEAKSLIQKYKLSSNISQNTKNLLSSNLKLYDYNTKKDIKILNLIIKADTQGTIDALVNSLVQIPQSKIQLNILSSGLGVVSNTDLDLASNTKALIIVFNLDIDSNILNKAEQVNVRICHFVIIYDFLEYIKSCMLDLIDPEYNKVLIGQATVQTIFSVNKGVVAGCIVKFGKLKKNALISVYRYDQLIYEGNITSLKQLKDNVDEVSMNHECGVMCNDYNLWQSQDNIKAYELYPRSKTL
nr:translation initiation factor 2 [Gracilaria edulis]